MLTEKIEEFKLQKNEYDKLVNENQQLNCYKRNILMLEQEKRELESRLAVISSTRRSATPDGDLGADDLKGQVCTNELILVLWPSLSCYRQFMNKVLSIVKGGT